MKKLFSKVISLEQFWFLEGQKIHEAIGLAQETLQSIKTKQLPTVVIKLDLLETYGIVVFSLRLLLIHIGFNLSMANWIMSCISYIYYVLHI